jgi:hypothetical protein
MWLVCGAMAVLTPQETQALDRVGKRLATAVYGQWGRDSQKDVTVLNNAASPRWQARFVKVLKGCAARGGGCNDPMTCLPRGPVSVVGTAVARPDDSRPLIDIQLRDQAGHSSTVRWTLLLETGRIDDVRCVDTGPSTTTLTPTSVAPTPSPAPPPPRPSPVAGPSSPGARQPFDTAMFAYRFIEKARQLEMGPDQPFLDFIVQNTSRRFQRELLEHMKACQVPGTDESESRSCHGSYFTCLPKGVAGVPSDAEVDADRDYAWDYFNLKAGDDLQRVLVISKDGVVDRVGCGEPPPPPTGLGRRGRCTGVPIQCGISFCGIGCFSNPERGSRGCIGQPMPCEARTIADCFDGCVWDNAPP